MTLEISHLVTSGCSFTYCQGLEDPATQGWPALLARKLNVPVVNLAVMGSGNDSIYRRTAEYFYINKNKNNKPFFIIAFSSALRREEFLSDYKGRKVGDFRTLACYGYEPIERAIYEQIDQNGLYFMERRKLLNWLSIINMFKANNTNYFTTNYMTDHEQSIMLIKNNYPNLFDTCYLDNNKIHDFHLLTRSLDKTTCQHDGLEAQHVVADYCYNMILEKYTKIIPIQSDYIDLKNYVANIDASPLNGPWFKHAWYEKK